MMNSSFFNHYRNSPSHSTYGPSARGVPVQNVRTTTTPSPKVVSIPVRFVGSEPERNRSESALKIQKLVRGFLVRKSVKKIASIKRDVVEIEKRILKKETVELIRKDSMEKLRVNEALMNLLLKLDSVRGVYSGIRDCRKAVINKAIGLQEVVDAIFSGDESLRSIGAAESCDRQTLITRGNASAIKHSTSESEYEHYSPDFGTTEESMQTTSNLITEAMDNCSTRLQLQEEHVKRIHENKHNLTDDLKQEELTVENHEETVKEERQLDSFMAPQTCDDRNDRLKQEVTMAEGNGNLVSRCGEVVTEEKKRSDELLEKMIDENGKMVGLIEDLKEKNELQTRLLSYLTQRVEQLEKSLLSENSRRKKRKQSIFYMI